MCPGFRGAGYLLGLWRIRSWVWCLVGRGDGGRKGKVEGWMWVLMDLERGMMWRRSSYKVLVQISFDNEDTLGR